MSSTSKKNPVSEEDARAMVRLLGQTFMVEGGHAEKKRFLMEGLCRLIAADCWVWVPVAPTKPGEPMVAEAPMHGGFSESRFVAFLEAIAHPDMTYFSSLFLKEVQARQSHTTRARQQMDPGNQFPKSDGFELWQAADISPILLSSYPFSDGSLSMVGLYRSQDKALFSERDSRIAHIVLSEVPWLHAQSMPTEVQLKKQRLAPRERTTLNLLLEGLGRKQISKYMDISENTVAGYIKKVYRYYEVQSHAELMRYFREGDGGDVERPPQLWGLSD